ncbi:uncharacterized protein [Physcomitrium patens]|uniref:Solanesyl diphosphate synthase n=1 Tax=Physcomitrium patens TaxID=3218 RepID=A0A2K1J8W4_PHYPA|nr:probable solanesyl-diphosphate synthase 3, chloroplastic isoform X2 [Physcomitrium patens]PNR37968.1 hypothetical protein PHYPA_021078 [Physcomitrium patens]|eukprot:XP_024398795.1 probable solanesyl-diphosphate synthase 3, chloroplastic isoform X2 [Physcomitrella patens]
MAMTALSCAGLPVASSLATSYIECSANASSAPRDVKPSTSVSKAAMEPCFVCRHPAASGSRNSLGPGRTTGLNGSHRSEDKSRRRLETVPQAAPPTLSFPERNSMANLETGAVPDISGRKTMNGGATSLPSTDKAEGKSKLTLADLVNPVSDDLRLLNDNLQKIVGADNPMLMAAAKQIFGAGGKRMRPALVFLVSRATCQLSNIQELRPQHRRLAEITEMIHTASLIHDDVLDESDTRRGKETVHQTFGTRVAVLAGDFMFAQSSWYLANLDNLEVIKLISQVIRDFASGEIKQAQNLFDTEVTLQNYLDKSYYKTASLIASSTKSAAIFSDSTPSVSNAMFDYGMHLGLAFQVVDDILDFTQTSEQLGKPAGSDLSKGNLTAPVLFALEKEPELRDLIDTEFTEEGSLEAAIALVHRGGGIDRARTLAKEQGDLAKKSLECLPQGDTRRSLERMVDYVLERIY